MKEIIGVIIFVMVGMTLFCLVFMLVDLWLGGVFSDYLAKKNKKVVGTGVTEYNKRSEF